MITVEDLGMTSEIYKNVNNVWVLKIYIGCRLVVERYNDHDETELHKLLDVAEEMYRAGFSAGRYD